MEQALVPVVVGVRFSKVGKVYHFTADNVTDVKVGDMVVVETSRGWQLGQVAQVLENPQRPPEGWKPIDRRATPRDLLLRQMWQMKEAEVVNNCRSRATDLRLVGIKIVSAEYSFDGARLTILFSSETEEKYELKSLRQDMQKMFAPSQVELRQVGPRDVAKVHCGMGACGLETRCCCLFLTEFSSISIRMAKEQGISLTPTEITGMCGRLRCCLIYEYDNYVDARSKLPKRNKRVRTPQGDGKVVDIIPLRESVIVELPEVGNREFKGTELILLDENGVPTPEQPYYGTRQPSEIDQAITGDSSKDPFAITGETIDLDEQGPPQQARERQSQRPGGPPRGDRPRRSGPGGRGQPGGKNLPQQQTGPKSGDMQRGPQPGGRKPQGPARSADEGSGDRSGGQPGRQQRPSQRPDKRGTSSRGRRDIQRKKGKRRDSTDTDNKP